MIHSIRVGHEARGSRFTSTEGTMKTPKLHRPARAAILTLAEIKAAVADFDRGDVNVFQALEAVLAALGAGEPVVRPRERAVRRRPRAA